jgi:YidC/Oxa1 family membrane protein insertase
VDSIRFRSRVSFQSKSRSVSIPLTRLFLQPFLIQQRIRGLFATAGPFGVKEKKMEQTRLLLAIGLSFLVLFFWSMFFVDQQPVKQTQEPVPSDQPAAEKQVAVKKDATAPPTVKEDAAESAPMDLEQEGRAREITIETKFYRVTISTKGATFTSYVLKKFRESVEPDAPQKELVPQDLNTGLIRTSLDQQSVVGLDAAVFSVDRPESDILVSDTKQSLAFEWDAGDGTTLTKTYTFDPDSYLIDLKVVLSNASERMIKDNLVLSIRNRVVDDRAYGFVGPSALIDDQLKQVKIKKIEDNREHSGRIKWIGVEDRYFLSSIVPGDQTNGRMRLDVIDNLVVNQLVTPTFELLPGEQKEAHFLVFMGPKSMELLNSLGHGLGKALNFGFFNFIAKPCLWFMNQIHSVIPNYGIAIILLTICTKILLWPLGNKSYKSMSEMKKLQPLMTEIREKYKGDKQKMNQELMALYRTYKVNPMGGCLPMILQIPVFFALYRMLYQAIELRHAPFLLWINDLSAPDRLFDFGVSIPFMEPPYGIPVLTIIMGASMILQQKMSPPPGDPTQAKMMMLMPVVFTFIFINFSSGLVLYWLVNNVLSISQQYYVQKKTQ